MHGVNSFGNQRSSNLGSTISSVVHATTSVVSVQVKSFPDCRIPAIWTLGRGCVLCHVLVECTTCPKQSISVFRRPTFRKKDPKFSLLRPSTDCPLLLPPPLLHLPPPRLPPTGLLRIFTHHRCLCSPALKLPDLNRFLPWDQYSLIFTIPNITDPHYKCPPRCFPVFLSGPDM